MHKGKTTSFSLQGFDLAHIKSTYQYAKAVEEMYARATDDIAKMASRGQYDPDKPFNYDDYPSVRKYVDGLSKSLANGITSIISSGSRNEWLFACKKNDEFIASIIDTSKLTKARLQKMQDRNLDALQAFQQRKVNGMDLSQRVWQYTEQYKEQIELGLDVGLGEGRSAQQVSQDLRQDLKDPDRLFRRVRDKRGNLQLSKAARAFHPGQGVYRSSVRNAMRLTRSEINMSYRESDWQRWQGLDFVIGFEVHRGHQEPLCDCNVCKKLVGKYPKWFKFKGWHPQCLCYATPILMDEDDYDNQELSDLKNALRGKEYKKLEVNNAITDVPQGFIDWVSNNISAQKKWSSTPYFVKDNFIDGDLSKGLRIVKTSTNKPVEPPIDPFKRELDALMPEIDKIKALADEWGLSINMIDYGIKNKNIAGIRMSIDNLKKEINDFENGLNSFLIEIKDTIQKAKALNIDTIAAEAIIVKVTAFKKAWSLDNAIYKQRLEDLKIQINGGKFILPNELKSKSNYLHGKDYEFDKDFFELIDPKKPIKFELHNTDAGSYSSYNGDKVYIAGKKRRDDSLWETKGVIYHEYGHCIDAQRTLWKNKELIDMRNKHIKSLEHTSKYVEWTKVSQNDGTYTYERTIRIMSRVEYIDNKLLSLNNKIWSMNDDTFTNKGIAKMDVIEQILSVRDTIKSLIVRYGCGHSDSYFSQTRASETEYLAHAFENTFLGNPIFKKYLPDIYDDMVAYIKELKPV